MKKISSEDRATLIRLASSLPKGSPEKKAILAGLEKVSARTVPFKVGELRYSPGQLDIVAPHEDMFLYISVSPEDLQGLLEGRSVYSPSAKRLV
jgi:hypothetical protein